MDIRFATINDIDAVTELERQCFPPEEAAEKDSFEKRLTVFPNLSGYWRIPGNWQA